MSYDNNNSGALFKNDKEGNEKRPDYRGQAEVDRVEFWVSAWIREAKSGAKYMQLKFEPKKAAEHSANRKKEAPKSEEEFSDDIPF
jgi:uncharacterized protein (DUF736 family)